MKRLLITGARGLLGSACVRLLSKDYDVVTPDDDLTHPQKVYWMFDRLRPWGVLHCAAKVGGVKANRDNPVEFIEQNVAINGNVIAACNLYDVEKLVNIGTSCMYPENAHVPVKESSFMTGPLCPDVEAYAQAKILAYSLCNAYRRQFSRDYVTVAPCNLYGPNDNYGEEAHVIPRLIAKAFDAKKNNSNLQVWGDGSAVREFLHTDDAAKAIKIVLEGWSSPELVNIGSGVSTRIKDLAEEISYLVGVKEIDWLPSEPTGIQEKTFDISRLLSLGWEQEIPLMVGLHQIVHDYQNNINIRKK